MPVNIFRNNFSTYSIFEHSSTFFFKRGNDVTAFNNEIMLKYFLILTSTYPLTLEDDVVELVRNDRFVPLVDADLSVLPVSELSLVVFTGDMTE